MWDLKFSPYCISAQVEDSALFFRDVSKPSWVLFFGPSACQRMALQLMVDPLLIPLWVFALWCWPPRPSREIFISTSSPGPSLASSDFGVRLRCLVVWEVGGEPENLPGTSFEGSETKMVEPNIHPNILMNTLYYIYYIVYSIN